MFSQEREDILCQDPEVDRAVAVLEAVASAEAALVADREAAALVEVILDTDREDREDLTFTVDLADGAIMAAVAVLAVCLVL